MKLLISGEFIGHNCSTPIVTKMDYARQQLFFIRWRKTLRVGLNKDGGEWKYKIKSIPRI
ncbi:MAG TPA: hypothetical protein VFS31_02355 [Chitinophagaceae bacterium]|nr:hypothetical protein [Chitinophagaceae bacterium]